MKSIEAHTLPLPADVAPGIGTAVIQRTGRSVKRWCAELDISQSYFYELKAKGLIDAVKVFGKLIVLTDPREFVESFRTGNSKES